MGQWPKDLFGSWEEVAEEFFVLIEWNRVNETTRFPREQILI